MSYENEAYVRVFLCVVLVVVVLLYAFCNSGKKT